MAKYCKRFYAESIFGYGLVNKDRWLLGDAWMNAADPVRTNAVAKARKITRYNGAPVAK